MTAKRRPMWKDRITLCCNDCDAEKSVDRAFVRVNMQGPRGEPGTQVVDSLDTGDWTAGPVAPTGKPIIIGGAVNVDVWADSAESVATKTQVPQTVFRCAACSGKARSRAIVESAGAVVIGMDGKLVQ